MKKSPIESRPRYFTLEEKHAIIHEYLNSGLTKTDFWLQRTGKQDHGILLRWMRKFGYVSENGTDHVKIRPKSRIVSTNKPNNEQAGKSIESVQLSKRIEELEKQLKEAELKVTAFNTMVDLAEQELGVSIRKKFNTKPSKS